MSKKSLELGKQLNTKFAGHNVFIKKHLDDYVVTCKGAHFKYSDYMFFYKNRHSAQAYNIGFNEKGVPCAYKELPNNIIEIGCLRDSQSTYKKLILEIHKFIKHDRN